MRRDDPGDRDGGPDAEAIRVRLHGPGARSLRLGLGPAARVGSLQRPAAAMAQLQNLFDRNSFWACGRRREDLSRMLRHSQVAVSVWDLAAAGSLPPGPHERAMPAWPACPVEAGPPGTSGHAPASRWWGIQPRLVGFGRASSDGRYRAVLWDVVVEGAYQGQGLGRRLVETLLQAPALREVERTYLMTTNSRAFYERLGFRPLEETSPGQQVLVLSRP